MINDYRKNCFNLIRLLAALQVFIGHAVANFDLKIPSVARVVYAFQGVPVFFCLSGFLIWGSIERSCDFKEYFKKRILRIYPELWAGVALSIITILILYFNNVKFGQLALFAVTQGSVFQFWTPDFLRGFGNGTPNGSLWTMGVIVQYYIVAWFLYRWLNCKSRWVTILIIGLAVNIIMPYFESWGIVYKLLSQTFVPYLWLFLIGSFVWRYRDKCLAVIVRLAWVFPLVIIVMYYFNISDYGIYPTIRSVCLALGAIGLGYKYPQINIKQDWSYGLYIYHMVVINVFVQLGLVGKWEYLLLSLIISMLIAALSYNLMQNFKRKAVRKK